MKRLASLLIASAAWLSGCEELHEERAANLSGDLAAISVIEMHQGQGRSFTREVLLEDSSGARVVIVRATRADELRVAGWSGEASLRLCAQDSLVRPSAAMTPDGHRVKIESCHGAGS